jgi:hypothetical protein
LVVPQAKVTQQANLMAGKRSAPIWALAAIMFLGWNEFMAVLWNPVLLIAGLFTFVFGYQMYNELDVDAELQRGWVMGGMNIWNKLGDVVKTVSYLWLTEPDRSLVAPSAALCIGQLGALQPIRC